VAGGNVNVVGNTSATAVDISLLTNVTGNLAVRSNAPDATVHFGSLSKIGGGTDAATVDLRGGTFLFASGFSISSNVFLTGFGNIIASLTNAGGIIPGGSPGRFDIAGHLALTASSELRLELNGYIPGSQFDFLAVTGSVTLGGALRVTLINNFQRALTNGASFTVLTAGSPITGSFADAASGASLTTPDGYARFTVRYAGETSVRLTDAVLVDTDNDGMPDWWEDQFGFDKTNSADATLDFDNDGASNANEFLAGTQPNNAASLFRIVSFEREANDIRLTWTTVGGKGYGVQTSGNLNGTFTDVSRLITVPGTGESATNFVDAGAFTNIARYYRIRVQP
jgi:hypothetical protein